MYVNKNINLLFRIFPNLNNKNDIIKLKIDNESLNYISLKEYANKISNIINYHINDLGLDSNKLTLTDATAGVGGNTLSFAKKLNLKKIYAIEINKLRCDYLKNNIKIYNLNNIKIINDDYLNYYNKLNNDIVFIDPPWGGSIYKKYKLLKLYLSDISLEAICNSLLNKNNVKMIILKLPQNFDIINFYCKIYKSNIYYYDLEKMMILVIINSSIK